MAEISSIVAYMKHEVLFLFVSNSIVILLDSDLKLSHTIEKKRFFFIILSFFIVVKLQSVDEWNK